MNEKILDFIKKNQKVTMPQIQKEFSLKYSEALDILDKIVKTSPVTYDGENYYSYPKQLEPKQLEQDDADSLEKRRQALIDRLNEFVDDNGYGKKDNGDKDDEEKDETSGEFLSTLYLAQKRKEILDFMDKLNIDEDDNEDEKDEKKRPDIINGEKVDVKLVDMAINSTPIDLQRMRLLNKAKNGLKVTQKGSKVFIKTFKYTEISFELVNKGDEALLTDNGDTFKRLKENNVSVDGAVLRAIEVILSEHRILRDGEILSVKVCDDDIFVRFCDFFIAVQRISTLDIGKVEELAEQRKLDEFRFNIMEQLIKNNPKIKRSEAILCMKDKYIKTKDSNDMDEIIIYAKAVKEFGMLSDEQFEQCRKQIVGE